MLPPFLFSLRLRLNFAIFQAESDFHANAWRSDNQLINWWFVRGKKVGLRFSAVP